MGFLMYTTITLFILVAVFLILLILIQKGRGGGLASAFGGAGGNTAFGSKTGDVLTWATSIVFGIFIVLAISLNLLAKPEDEVAEVPNTAAQSSGAPASPQVPPLTGAGPAVKGEDTPVEGGSPTGAAGLAAPTNTTPAAAPSDALPR